MNNDDNENLPNIFNISNNRLNSQSNFDDFMINQLTNILTNRINSNSNNFFSIPSFSNRINNNNSFIPLQSNFNVSNIIQNSLYQSNPYKKVTSDSGMSQIKKIIFKGKEQETKECAITQDKFTEGQEIAQLPCKHIFEKEAIETWLKEESNSCPVCRYELDFKEVCMKVPQERSNEVLTDSDDDIPDLIEETLDETTEQYTEQQRQQIEQRREQIVDNINRIIRNIQFVNQAPSSYRQPSFSTDRDLQYALMASLNESQPCEEKSEEDFISHPDTQHDEQFNEIMSDSDDELNQVD